MFVALNNGAVDDDSTCSSASQRNESYAFLIFWFILSFVLIFSYICLVFYGYSQIKRSASVKKSTLQLLRNSNHDNEMANDMYESALNNI